MLFKLPQSNIARQLIGAGVGMLVGVIAYTLLQYSSTASLSALLVGSPILSPSGEVRVSGQTDPSTLERLKDRARRLADQAETQSSHRTEQEQFAAFVNATQVEQTYDVTNQPVDQLERLRLRNQRVLEARAATQNPTDPSAMIASENVQEKVVEQDAIFSSDIVPAADGAMHSGAPASITPTRLSDSGLQTNVLLALIFLLSATLCIRHIFLREYVVAASLR